MNNRLIFSTEEKEFISLANELYGHNTRITISPSHSSKGKIISLEMNCYSYLHNIITGDISIGMLTRKILLLMYIQLRLEKEAFSSMGMTDAKEIDNIIATTRNMIINELNVRRLGITS